MLDKATIMDDKVISPDLEALFYAGAHVGHSKSRRHPKMGKFVFATRSNIEILNLQLTEQKLQEAERFLYKLGKENKLVLWVGTKPAARKHVEEVAMSLNMPHVVERWLGGLLTNFKALSDRLSYWQRLEKEVAGGGLDKYVKKERLLKLVELRKLNRMFGGLRALRAIPDALVIVDPQEEHTAQAEGMKKNIPIVAIVNNDCDPTSIAYPIPANDDASKVIALVLARLSAAYEGGKRESAHAASAAEPAS